LLLLFGGGGSRNIGVVVVVRVEVVGAGVAGEGEAIGGRKSSRSSKSLEQESAVVYCFC
jgi:hypothetical protein